jgi:hypothetical protein
VASVDLRTKEHIHALLKQSLIDRATVEASLKEAGLYTQALCIDCSPEVERETLRIAKQIKPEEPVPVADASIAAAPRSGLSQVPATTSGLAGSLEDPGERRSP